MSTPADRIGRLERSIPAPPCDTCEGQRLRIVYEDAPASETCPACGVAILIVRFRTDERGPQ